MTAYFDCGFSVRQPMWHGKGTVLEDYPTDWADARAKAGLLWEPELVDCYQMLDDGSFAPVPGTKLSRRNDTKAVLAAVSDEFSLVYHSTMGEILEAVTGLGTNVKFETAGSLKGGAVVWALVYIDEPVTIAGDNSPTYPFLALLNPHNGTGAAKLVKTSVRIVCWNTYSAADLQGERTGQQFTFRHTGDVLGRIEEAKAALAGVRQAHAEWIELANDLATLNVDDVAVEKFAMDFIPLPVGDVVSDRVKANVERARGLFRNLYFDSFTTEAHRGTALGLVDAGVEYLDHVRTFRDRDTYVGRTLLRPEPQKARLLTLAREHSR